MVTLKPHVTCSQVEVQIGLIYSTPEGLRRLAQAILTAAQWLEKAQTKKTAK